MGYHILTTTTHPSNVNLPSSGQQSTAWLSARKVCVNGWGTGSKTPSSGTLQYVEQTMCRACVRFLGNSGKY